jgi:hypothetical protein
MRKRKGGGAAGDAVWGKNRLTIDKPGFWPSLTDEEVELMRTRLRSRLSEAQAKRADREAERRAERKAKPKPRRRRGHLWGGRFEVKLSSDDRREPGITPTGSRPTK